MIRLLGFINRVGEVFPIRAPGVCQLADTFHLNVRVHKIECPRSIRTK